MRSRRTVVLLLLTVGLFLAIAPAALGGFVLYFDRQQMNPGYYYGGSTSAAHNYYFNEMCPCGGSWPTGIYIHTDFQGDHYAVNGYGTISKSEAAQYFGHATCWNRDSGSHYVDNCNANW